MIKTEEKVIKNQINLKRKQKKTQKKMKKKRKIVIMIQTWKIKVLHIV